MPPKPHPPAKPRKKQPRVGIFWLVGGRLLIEGVLVSEAEPYGDHLTYPRSHLEVWTQFQQSGIIPPDIEYEEFPRGRVMLNTKSGRFTLLADSCILNDNRIVSKIMSEMKVPSEKTDKERDSHYRCAACLRGNPY